MNNSEEGFIHCAILDGKGGARFLDPEEAKNWNEQQGALWMHMDYEDENQR